MYAQFFFSEIFLNMHIASDTIFTIEGFILWPYSSQVTSSLFAKTVPRGGKYIRFIIQSNLLRTAKGQSKKSASKLLSSPDGVTFKIPLRDLRIKKNET